MELQTQKYITELHMYRVHVRQFILKFWKKVKSFTRKGVSNIYPRTAHSDGCA